MTGKKTLFNVGYYKKGGVFTGSDAGMRYRVAKTGDGVLTAWAWPEPFAFAETPDERKVTFEAELSDEGLDSYQNPPSCIEFIALYLTETAFIF